MTQDWSQWVWMVHPEFGAHRVPDNPGVVPSFEGRGWQQTNIPAELDIDSEEFAAAWDAEFAADDEDEEVPDGAPPVTDEAEAPAATSEEKEAE